MTGIPPTDLADQLNREWRYLAARPAHIARARSWALTTVEFEDLHHLLALAGFGDGDRVRSRRADQLLGELVVASRHDPLAGRIVLQRVLPGLLAACHRWRRGCPAAGADPEETLGELVGVAWSVIRAYSTERRPRNVAWNILSDTVYRAFVGPSRRLRANERPRKPRRFNSIPAPDDRHPLIELAGVIRDARDARVDPRHTTLICDLLRADGSAERVAVDRGVTGRTIRTQRARAIARVRSVALSSAA
jgi:hypothetical protein